MNRGHVCSAFLQARKAVEKQLKDAKAHSAQLSSSLDARRNHLNSALARQTELDRTSKELEALLAEQKSCNVDLQQQLLQAVAAKDQAVQVDSASPF